MKLLATMFVVYQNTYWHCTIGFATGLAVAVHLANIYLSKLDDEFTAAFRDHLKFYWRFVDDCIFCIEEQNADAALQFLNSWHPSIVWEQSARGKSVTFLDLTVSIEPTGVGYCTYRKPTNK